MSGTFFPFVGAFIWISILLSLGVFLRSKIGFLQNKLIPAALIGGIIGFFLMNFGIVGMPTANGWQEIPPRAFAVLVFHLFAFGFVGIGLMEQVKNKDTSKGHWIRSGALWMALIYCMLAIRAFGRFINAPCIYCISYCYANCYFCSWFCEKTSMVNHKKRSGLFIKPLFSFKIQ